MIDATVRKGLLLVLAGAAALGVSGCVPTRLLPSDYDQTAPATDGLTVVWEDSRNAATAGTDVYLYDTRDLDPEPGRRRERRTGRARDLQRLHRLDRQRPASSQEPVDRTGVQRHHRGRHPVRPGAVRLGGHVDRHAQRLGRLRTRSRWRLRGRRRRNLGGRGLPRLRRRPDRLHALGFQRMGDHSYVCPRKPADDGCLEQAVQPVAARDLR